LTDRLTDRGSTSTGATTDGAAGAGAAGTHATGGSPAGASAVDDPAARQTYLGSRGLIAFLVLLTAFVALSTDLYLPALPTITAHFGVPEYLTNLTLILFFVFYAVGTLMWGPFSDKYGRRPILIIGLTIYAIGGGLCALSANVYQLMLFRVLQAIGAGAASAVSIAIVKDVYRGRRREGILAIIQSLVVFAPAVAPIVGAFLLNLTSWRGTFVAQAVIGATVVAGSIAFRETLEERTEVSVIRTLGRLGVVLKNPGFASLLPIFALVSISNMAYIAASSYIYQDDFQVSSQTYSYYYALNAVAMMFGPGLYMRLSRRFERFSIISACFVVMMMSGLLVYLLGETAPWVFAVALFPTGVIITCTRPPLTYLLLEQQTADTGSASALMSAAKLVMGSIGMMIVSFDWESLIHTVGALNMVIGALSGTLWFLVRRRSLVKKPEEA
jgi:DHA1 family bicyclomycin/chloramphenicol resistance-like MFS transporter